MTARNEIVTVYVNESIFLQQQDMPKNSRAPKRSRTERRTLPKVGERNKNPNICRCLGVFEMYSAVLQKDSSEEIIQCHSLNGASLNLLSLFREVPYYRFHLRPLFDNESIQRLVDPDAAPMKLLTVPRSCIDKVNVYVSTEWLRNQLSTGCDSIVMREDLVRQFIDGGGLCKFGYEMEEEISDNDDDEYSPVVDDVESVVEVSSVVLDDCQEDGEKNADGDSNESVEVDSSVLIDDWQEDGEKDADGDSVESVEGGSSEELGDCQEDGEKDADGDSVESEEGGSSEELDDCRKEVDRKAHRRDSTESLDVEVVDEEEYGAEDYDQSSYLEGYLDASHSMRISTRSGIFAQLISPATAGMNSGKLGKISSSLPELLAAMMLCQYSGANRYMCHSLVKIGTKLHATPMFKTNSPLPSVFAYRAMPMPNRAMDGISMCLREDAKRLGILKNSMSSTFDHTRLVRPFDHEDLVLFTFKAIVLRFTGRIYPHCLYAERCGKKSWSPDISDIDEYLAFMEKTLPPTEDYRESKITQWISEQHIHSIPDATKMFPYFCEFLRAVVSDLTEVVDKMTSESTSREETVILLSNYLRDCCVSSQRNGNFIFLSQQIIADVEEIFDFPYGRVLAKGLKPGSGSIQGNNMLKNGGLKGGSFSSTLSAIVSYFEESASDEELSILGYRRVTDADKPLVLNVVNGRPFNSTDAEHFLCKCWLIAKYTLPHYTASVQPLSSKPHCHPIRKGISTIQFPYMTVIMKQVIAAFEASDRRCVETPGFCLMAGEMRNAAEKQHCSSLATDRLLSVDSKKPPAIVSPDKKKRQRTESTSIDFVDSDNESM